MTSERAAEQHRYIGFLHSLRKKEDRGSLASLRRGLGKPPATVPEMFPLVIPRLPAEATRWEEELYFLIGSLFAYHPTPEGKGDMGEVFRQISLKADSKSIENRFVALLRAHRDDLKDHLRHAIALAKSNEINVNWNELFRDLKRWNSSYQTTQRKWANSFWKERMEVVEEKEVE